MPTLFKMSDDKKTDEMPAVVFTETERAPPQRKTKKYVIIAVSAVLAVAIILTAILVGMYMFTQAQKEIIQYTMQLGSNKQDVTSDPNENIVQYHVTTPSQDAWIINDFNKDLQVMKIVSDGQTNCFLTALNRTNAMDPSLITGPDTKDPTTAISLKYRFADTPIADTSFLGKTASAACKGVSVYWLYPYCSDGKMNIPNNGTNMGHPMKKRQTTVNNAPYYCKNDAIAQSGYNGNYYYVPCVTACCEKICACNITITSTLSNGQMTCNFISRNCPPTFTANPLYQDPLCVGPSGIDCASKGATRSCGCP